MGLCPEMDVVEEKSSGGPIYLLDALGQECGLYQCK